MFEKKIALEKSSESDKSNFLDENLDKKNILQEVKKQPLHTMQSDLADINLSVEKSTPIAPAENNNSKIENTPFAHSREEIIQEDQPQAEKNGTKSKVLITLIFLLIIVLLIGTGYYFWATRIKNTTSTETTAKDTAVPSTIPSFSQEQANYMTLDISDESSDAKKTIQEYAAMVSQMDATTPVQFIITDSLNNPVSFPIFAQKLGLSFSSDVLAQLGDTFSFYIYSDDTQPHFGLSIIAKDGALLKIAIEKQDGSFFQTLKPLFPEGAVTPEVLATFKESSYQGNIIHYANLPTAPGFSIDYTIIQNQLVIGTSKMTTRSILDSLTAEPAQPTN